MVPMLITSYAALCWVFQQGIYDFYSALPWIISLNTGDLVKIGILNIHLLTALINAFFLEEQHFS